MKKLFLRTITLILIATLLLCTLTACGEDYELRKSSKKEATPVLTLGEDTVNFEVLYTFFRNQCDKIPSFSSTYFDGAEGLARFNATLGAAIGEISEMVGYADTAHFARTFKKLENMSANEYRNSLPRSGGK